MAKKYQDTLSGKTYTIDDEYSDCLFLMPDDGGRTFGVPRQDFEHWVQVGTLVKLSDDSGRIKVPGWFASKDDVYKVPAPFRDRCAAPECNHDFINMGFMHLKLVCKHCNAEQ